MRSGHAVWIAFLHLVEKWSQRKVRPSPDVVLLIQYHPNPKPFSININMFFFPHPDTDHLLTADVNGAQIQTELMFAYRKMTQGILWSFPHIKIYQWYNINTLTDNYKNMHFPVFLSMPVYLSFLQMNLISIWQGTINSQWLKKGWTWQDVKLGWPRTFSLSPHY